VNVPFLLLVFSPPLLRMEDQKTEVVLKCASVTLLHCIAFKVNKASCNFFVDTCLVLGML